jgi:predicted deacylase
LVITATRWKVALSQTDLFQRRQLVGRQPSSHLLVLEGIHGDEFELMVAIRRRAAKLRADELRGTLTLARVADLKPRLADFAGSLVKKGHLAFLRVLTS